MSQDRSLSGVYFTEKHRSTTYDFISPLNISLSGKHVLITGAHFEDGVGFATATAFARAGASAIAIVDVHKISETSIAKLKNAATTAERSEPTVLIYEVDITHRGSVQAMRDAVSRDFSGRLDILVNNAAFTEPTSSFLEADPDMYWRSFGVNVQGLFNMAREFLPMLLSSRAEHNGLCTMINVASSGALTARAGSGSYRSSKLAVVRWTETLDLEYGKDGLFTLSVNPGAIKTMMTSYLPDEVRDWLPDRPEVAGDTIAWLAAEKRDWLAGRYVSCVWDMEELVQKKDDIVEKDKLKIRMVFLMRPQSQAVHYP